jgi:hypothetical protein
MLALTQSRLRCPLCSVVLLPPPGARQFRCPCGVTLRTPAAQLQISAQTNADSAAPQASAVTRDQLDLSNLDNLLVGREAGRKGNGVGGEGASGEGTAGGGGGGGGDDEGHSPSKGGVGRYMSVRERILSRRDKVRRFVSANLLLIGVLGGLSAGWLAS